MSHQGYEADDMEEEYEMEDPDHHIDDEFHDRDTGGSDSDMDEYDEIVMRTILLLLKLGREEARKGRHIQGIPWERLSITREKYRQTRLEQYKNYENMPQSGEGSEKDCKNTEKGGLYYVFRRNSRSVKSTILHFQQILYSSRQSSALCFANYFHNKKKEKEVSYSSQRFSSKFIRSARSPSFSAEQRSGVDHKYRTEKKTYSRPLFKILIPHQNNELLMKNHELRPTGSAALPEANATFNHDNRRGRGNQRGRRHVYGRGKPNDETSSNKRHKTSNEHTSSKKEASCHRCGMTGHWARTCRTAKYLADLYQDSIKGKERKETNNIDFDGPIDITHLDVSDFFDDPKGDNMDQLIIGGVLEDNIMDIV